MEERTGLSGLRWFRLAALALGYYLIIFKVTYDQETLQALATGAGVLGAILAIKELAVWIIERCFYLAAILAPSLAAALGGTITRAAGFGEHIGGYVGVLVVSAFLYLSERPGLRDWVAVSPDVRDRAVKLASKSLVGGAILVLLAAGWQARILFGP